MALTNLAVYTVLFSIPLVIVVACLIDLFWNNDER